METILLHIKLTLCSFAGMRREHFQIDQRENKLKTIWPIFVYLLFNLGHFTVELKSEQLGKVNQVKLTVWVDKFQ